MNAGSGGRSEERKLNAECNVQCNAIDCGGTGELHSGGVRSLERTRGWFEKEGKKGALSLLWGSELRNYFVRFLKCPAPGSDVSAVFCLYLQCGVCSPDFFLFGWRLVNVEGVERRKGREASSHICVYSLLSSHVFSIKNKCPLGTTPPEKKKNILLYPD